METIEVRTAQRDQFVEITERVEQAFRTMRRGTLTRARAKAKSSGMLSGLLPAAFARPGGQQTRKRKRPQTLSENHAIRTFVAGS